MRNSRGVPTPTCLALIVVSRALTAPTALAEGADATFDVERRALSAGTPVVSSGDAQRAFVTVCVATDPRDPEPLEAPTVLASHGVVEHDADRFGASVACLSAAPATLPYLLDVVKRRLAVDVAVDAARTPDAFARALAVEGAEPTTASRGRAVAITGALGAEPWTVIERGLGVTRPASPDPPPPWTLHQTTERLSVLDGEMDAPNVDYVWITPSTSPVDAASLRVGFELLARPDSGRLQRLLVARGLARRYSLERVLGEGGEFVRVHVDASTKGPLDRIRRFVDGALKQERLVGPSVVDVRNTVARLSMEDLAAWDDMEERARSLAITELLHGDARAAAPPLGALSRVSPERVRKTMHDAIVDARRSTVETYPKTWPEDDPARAGHRLYTVAAGDTLESIAARFHVDASRIAHENDVDPRYRLTPGQPLWIPPK